jgi:hypothetical protein
MRFASENENLFLFTERFGKNDAPEPNDTVYSKRNGSNQCVAALLSIIWYYASRSRRSHVLSPSDYPKIRATGIIAGAEGL